MVDFTYEGFWSWTVILLGDLLVIQLPYSLRTSLVAQTVKRLLTMQKTWVQSLGLEDPLEKEMATHSITLAWKIPWTEECGRLQSLLVCADFLFFHHSVLVRYVSRNLSISSKLSNLLGSLFIIVFYSLYFCGICCNVSCFTYNFIWVISFLKICQFCLFFKKPTQFHSSFLSSLLPLFHLLLLWSWLFPSFC